MHILTLKVICYASFKATTYVILILTWLVDRSDFCSSYILLDTLNAILLIVVKYLFVFYFFIFLAMYLFCIVIFFTNIHILLYKSKLKLHEQNSAAFYLYIW